MAKKDRKKGLGLRWIIFGIFLLVFLAGAALTAKKVLTGRQAEKPCRNCSPGRVRP